MHFCLWVRETSEKSWFSGIRKTWVGGKRKALGWGMKQPERRQRKSNTGRMLEADVQSCGVWSEGEEVIRLLATLEGGSHLTRRVKK